MVIHFAVAALTTRRLSQRECPICGHIQLVPPSKMREVVTCERCDYAIAPKRKIAA
jgi:ribosomal protein S27E